MNVLLHQDILKCGVMDLNVRIEQFVWWSLARLGYPGWADAEE